MTARVGKRPDLIIIQPELPPAIDDGYRLRISGSASCVPVGD
jgi:hypothetical protein